MKQFCLLCERSSSAHNLYCQETYCPAEMSPTILDYNEWLGDIEIVKVVVILRSAVLYEARQQQKKVLLKVAHPGEENKERLKREAEFLYETVRKTPQPYLPTWLPPYVRDDRDAHAEPNTKKRLWGKNQPAYGRIVLQGQLLYFYLMEYFDGESLRDVITQQPQLWVHHVGWIMITLSSAVAYMNSKQYYHFAVSPESALVRFDKKEPRVPRVLLVDFGVVSTKKTVQEHWYPFFLLPAYRAPELLESERILPDFRTDVYGLGLTFFEMLVGNPAFAYKLHSEEEVYQAVRNNRRGQMTREQDVQKIATIAVKATEQMINQRYATSEELAKALIPLFGQVPEQKKPIWQRFSLKQLFIAVAVALGLAFVIAIVVSIIIASIDSNQVDAQAFSIFPEILSVHLSCL